MSDEEQEPMLFEVKESISPRLAWERKHRIKTHFNDTMGKGQQWLAVQVDTDDETVWAHSVKKGDEGAGLGETREDAIAELIHKANIPPFGSDQIKK